MIIVYTYVVGDIIHRGHLLYLNNAKGFGDILVVGVLTDEAVMGKKPKPTILFEERLDTIKSLKMVDVAVAQENYSPVANIFSIKPDIVIESTSHNDKILSSTVLAAKTIGARVVNLPYWPGGSSTEIKERIKLGNKA